jgi:hypothetical protein
MKVASLSCKSLLPKYLTPKMILTTQNIYFKKFLKLIDNAWRNEKRTKTMTTFLSRYGSINKLNEVQ